MSMQSEDDNKEWPRRISEEEIRRDYPKLWARVVDSLVNRELNPIFICNLVIDTCPHCHEANRRCQCWNDE